MKGKEQRAVKVTNEVKDILRVKKLNLIKLKWKEEEVIDWVEVRGVDGESKGKLPKQSQGNNELYLKRRRRRRGILRKLNIMNHRQKGYVRNALKENMNFYGQTSGRNKASKM
jgi:hypothetical protein